MLEKITYVVMTQNRADAMRRNLETILPFVDKAVIIDGGSTTETISVYKDFGEKVFVYTRLWDDDFAAQWNEYLKYIDSGWILVLDDDELPSETMLRGLRKIVDKSNAGEKYSIVKFRAHPISEGQDLGVSNHYREVFFRYVPGMYYKCKLHQYIVGYQNGKVLQSDLEYFHIKPVKQEFEAACRNYWIGGIWYDEGGIVGINDGLKWEEWTLLKELVKKYHPGVKVFADFSRLIRENSLHSSIEKWIVYYYRLFEHHPWYSEARCFYRYFLSLYPEKKFTEVDISRPIEEQL